MNGEPEIGEDSIRALKRCRRYIPTPARRWTSPS
jgi:hypothetical protein